jgi:hypothetical protein
VRPATELPISRVRRDAQDLVGKLDLEVAGRIMIEDDGKDRIADPDLCNVGGV